MHPHEAATGAMDQRKEQEEEEEEQDNSNESAADQRKEEEEEQDNSEKSMPRSMEVKIYAEEVILEQPRKAEAEEERSSDGPEEEDAMEAWSLFAHPCSLLQYVIRACASRLGLHDPFGHPKPSAAPADSPSTQESGEDDTKTPTGFCMQGVLTRVTAVRRPRPPGNPREGTGGNGGHHH